MVEKRGTTRGVTRAKKGWTITTTLTGITPQIICNHIEHLCGDTNYRLAVRNHDGTMISPPRLCHVLGCDHVVRQHLANLMNDGVGFVSGLKASHEAVGGSSSLSPLENVPVHVRVGERRRAKAQLTSTRKRAAGRRSD